MKEKKPPTRQRRDQLTVVESVYHQPAGEPARQFTSRFSRPLEGDEQCYERRVTVGEEWMPIDCGWAGLPAMLMLVNGAQTVPGVNPTAEERAAVSEQVLEVGCLYRSQYNPIILILPGESCRFQPADVESFRVRCRSGNTKMTIRAIPN